MTRRGGRAHVPALLCTVAALGALGACGSDGVPWRLVGVDGRLLELEVAAAGCVGLQDLTVTESPTKVTIPTPTSTRWCGPPRRG